MVSWTRVDENLFAAEMVVSGSRRYRLTLERLGDSAWDWTVWREDRPEECRYGIVSGTGPGFEAAEHAVVRLVRATQPGRGGQSAAWLPRGMAGRP